MSLRKWLIGKNEGVDEFQREAPDLYTAHPCKIGLMNALKIKICIQ